MGAARLVAGLVGRLVGRLVGGRMAWHACRERGLLWLGVNFHGIDVKRLGSFVRQLEFGKASYCSVVGNTQWVAVNAPKGSFGVADDWP